MSSVFVITKHTSSTNEGVFLDVAADRLTADCLLQSHYSNAYKMLGDNAGSAAVDIHSGVATITCRDNQLVIIRVLEVELQDGREAPGTYKSNDLD